MDQELSSWNEARVDPYFRQLRNAPVWLTGVAVYRVYVVGGLVLLSV